MSILKAGGQVNGLRRYLFIRKNRKHKSERSYYKIVYQNMEFLKTNHKSLNFIPTLQRISILKKTTARKV